MNGDCSTSEAERNRLEAELQSRALLKAMLGYGMRNNGLPNMTREQCLNALAELARKPQAYAFQDSPGGA